MNVCVCVLMLDRVSVLEQSITKPIPLVVAMFLRCGVECIVLRLVVWIRNYLFINSMLQFFQHVFFLKLEKGIVDPCMAQV